MDIHLFFEGAGSREEASSAFLGTLLEQDEEFRNAFIARAAPKLAIQDSKTPKVSVEHPLGAGFIDVLLEYGSVVVLVENKISAGAKREGQLGAYYMAAVDKWPTKRLVTVYLAPNTLLGRSEVMEVRRQIRRNRRIGPAGDVAAAVSWGSVQSIVNRWGRKDPAFARQGMRAVNRSIESARARIYLNWSSEAFLDASREKGPHVLAVVGPILDWLQRIDPLVVMGNGKTGPLYITVTSAVDDHHKIGSVGLDGWVNVSYDKLRRAPPFDDPALLVALIRRLNLVPGMKARRIDEDFFEREGSSWIPPTILGHTAAMVTFLETLDWIRVNLVES